MERQEEKERDKAGKGNDTIVKKKGAKGYGSFRRKMGQTK